MSKQLSVLVVLFLLAQSIMFLPATFGESRTLPWGQKVQITYENKVAVSPALAIDSKNDLNIVWVQDHINITYKRITADNVTVINETVLGQSNEDGMSSPRIAVGPDDSVHITWVESSGSSPSFPIPRYMKLSPSGEVLQDKYDGGADNMQVDSLGLVHFLTVDNYYPGGGQGPPPTIWPLYYAQLNSSGDNLVGKEISKTRILDADYVLDPSTGVHIIFSYNGTTLNYTRLAPNGTTEIDAMPIVTGLSNISQIEVARSLNGDLLIAYVRSNPYRVYFMSVDDNGTLVTAPQLIMQAPTNEELIYFSITGPGPLGNLTILADFRPQGNDFMSALDVYTMEVSSDGTVLSPSTELMSYCPGNDAWSPTMAMDHNGAVQIVWDEQSCMIGPQWPPTETELYLLHNGPVSFLDLAVKKEGITLPAIVPAGRSFPISTRVWNLGNLQSGDFKVGLKYKSNGTSLGTSTMSLGPHKNDTATFNVKLYNSTNLTAFLDPLLNNDVDPLNNQVDFSVDLSYPDLWITEKNISISTPSPKPLENLTLNATVGNKGPLDATATVVFRDLTLSKALGQTSIHVPALSKNITSLLWMPMVPGKHLVSVTIKDSIPFENASCLGNNQAQRTITVLDQPPEIQILSPTVGEIVKDRDLNITGRANDLEGEKVTVEVRMDGKDPKIASWSSDINWYVPWDLSTYNGGLHTITAKASDGFHNVTATVNFTTNWTVPAVFRITKKVPAQDPTINEGTALNFSVEYESNLYCLVEVVWSYGGVEMQRGPGTSYILQTSFNSSGKHLIKVELSCGSLNIWTYWNLTVIDVNRPPQIISYSPSVGTVNVTIPEGTDLKVTALDPDNDVLSYTWSVNGTVVQSAMNKTAFQFKPDPPGTFVVTILVSDGKGGTAQRSWVVTGTRPVTKEGTYTAENAFSLLVLVVMIALVVSVIVYELRRKGTR